MKNFKLEAPATKRSFYGMHCFVRASTIFTAKQIALNIVMPNEFIGLQLESIISYTANPDKAWNAS
jgi:hypothetical protein